MPEADQPWFAVRTVLRFAWGRGTVGRPLYEERVTLWRANDFHEATARAIAEAEEYAKLLNGEYVGLAQAFHLGVEEVRDGDEVFSLMRESELPPDDYLDRYFDTGDERQATIA